MRRRSRRSGSAGVEFALSAILMTTICGAIFQFGYSMYIYNRLTSSVRSAARYAAVASYTSTTTTPATAYATAVKNVAVYGSPTVSSGTALVPNLLPANVSISVTMTGGVVQHVSVEIINYTVNAIFGSIQFNGKPESAFPYNG